MGRTGEAEYVYLQVFHDRFRYPETKLYVEFDYPLVRFDSAAVVLTEQMEKEEPRPIRIRWQQDTANMRRWWLDVPGN